MKKSILTISLIIVVIILMISIYFYISKSISPKKEIIDDVLKKNHNVIHVYSNDFSDQNYISPQYTCDGADVSPDLRWENIPSNTKSIAIIVYDPDAPKDYFIHWLVYNIPPNIYNLPQSSSPKGPMLLGGEGKNDFGKIGYGGPCPPHGATHKYIYLVVALDSFIHVDKNTSQLKLLNLIRDHAIAYGYITVLYKR